MSKPLKILLKYTLSFGLAALLLWYIYGDRNIGELLAGILTADPLLVSATLLLGIISHLVRAYRWNLLLAASGKAPHVFRTFLGVMVGYFVNIFTPKFGEAYRCVILRKTDNIPISSSFGTVITERTFDLLTSLLLIGLTLLLEADRLGLLISDIFTRKISGLGSMLTGKYLLLIIGILILCIAAPVIFWKKLKKTLLFLRIKEFLSGVITGILSIRKIKSNRLFLLHTVLIWSMYYVGTLLIIKALPETSDVTATAALGIFVVGSLGMSVPVQGGVGFLLFAGAAFTVYNVSDEAAENAATLLYASQLLPVFIGGGVAFLVSLLIERSNKSKKDAVENSR